MARGDVVTFRNNPGQLALASSNPQRLPGRRRKKYSLPSSHRSEPRARLRHVKKKSKGGKKKKRVCIADSQSPQAQRGVGQPQSEPRERSVAS